MCLWQKDIKLLNDFSFHSYENGILNKDAVFLFHRKDLVILTYESEYLYYEIKTLREDAHSRGKKMSLTRPRPAREFRKRNSLFLLLPGAGCYNLNLCDLISAL